jgi:hypothetical protein
MLLKDLPMNRAWQGCLINDQLLVTKTGFLNNEKTRFSK